MEDRTRNAVTGTRTTIDLGDDLLEATRLLPGCEETSESTPDALLPQDRASLHGATSARKSVEASAITDQLESVKILLGEGLIEEAKRILRRLVLRHPEHISARKKLDEVQELELKHIFEESHSPRSPEVKQALPPVADSDRIMRQLDQDLRLGIFGDGPAESAAILIDTCFGNREAMDRFAVKLDSELKTCSARDRMDIGIAFLEMGLFELAIRQFTISEKDPSLARASIALLAFAMISSGRPFEASMILKPVISDPEVPRHEKLDFLYLMGRAYERLGNPDYALECYAMVQEVDSHYRDVDDRIKISLETRREKK